MAIGDKNAVSKGIVDNMLVHCHDFNNLDSCVAEYGKRGVESVADVYAMRVQVFTSMAYMLFGLQEDFCLVSKLTLASILDE
ncbi:hypothetical protein N8Z80_03085 [Litorivicinus sp.]|nr:hypothetical protein [Litorivicinus sp.]